MVITVVKTVVRVEEDTVHNNGAAAGQQNKR